MRGSVWCTMLGKRRPVATRTAGERDLTKRLSLDELIDWVAAAVDLIWDRSAHCSDPGRRPVIEADGHCWMGRPSGSCRLRRQGPLGSGQRPSWTH